MPQILIEVIFLLFLAGSAVWGYITRTTKTVANGVKDKIREHKGLEKPHSDGYTNYQMIKPPIIKTGGFYMHKFVDDEPHYEIIIFNKKFALHFGYYLPISSSEKEILNSLIYLISHDDAALYEGEESNKDCWCRYSLVNDKTLLRYKLDLSKATGMLKETFNEDTYFLEYHCNIKENGLFVDYIIKDEYDRLIYRIPEKLFFRYTEVLLYN